MIPVATYLSSHDFFFMVYFIEPCRAQTTGALTAMHMGEKEMEKPKSNDINMLSLTSRSYLCKFGPCAFTLIAVHCLMIFFDKLALPRYCVQPCRMEVMFGNQCSPRSLLSYTTRKASTISAKGSFFT